MKKTILILALLILALSRGFAGGVFSVSVTEIVKNKCTGDCKSQLVATVSNGTAPYTYTWTLPNGSTITDISNSPTDTLKNACTGNFYDYDVTDAVLNEANGDILTASFAPISISFSSNTSPSCNSSSDGSVTASAFFGAGGFTYSWSNGEVTKKDMNIVAGTYTITVTDMNACTNSSSVVLTSPAAIISNGTSTNILCNGQTTGTASVNPSGGTPAYTYSWSTLSASSGLTGLSAGGYTVTITDSKSCTITYSANIIQPAMPLSVSSFSVAVSCFGLSNGSAWVVPSGGTPAYTYTWSPASSTGDSIAPIGAGTYTCTVTDANACSVTTSIVVTQPAVIATLPIGTNITCNAACNGMVTANPSGGNGAYTYSWSPGGATSQTVNSLCQGTYSVTLTDSKSCSVTGSVSITQPMPLIPNASSTNTSCFGDNNGSVQANPSGGTPPYTYIWSNASGASSQTGLVTGNYTVTITDQNSCTATQIVTVAQPAVLNINSSSTPVSCFGSCNGTITSQVTGGTHPYTFVWSSNSVNDSLLSNLCNLGYTVTVTDAKGCTATTAQTITQPTQVTASIVVTTPVSCFNGCNGALTVTEGGGSPAYTQTWSNGGNTVLVNGLCATGYTVTVTDQKSCTNSSSVILTQPSQLTLTLNPTQILCSGSCNGAITAMPAGGTSGYTYSWSNAGTVQNLSSLCANGYTLTVTDANGCTATSNSTIAAPNPLLLVINADSVSCHGFCDAVATAAPSGGAGSPYSYSWSHGGATTSSISALCVGTYTVTVTDENNCQVTGTIGINQPNVINPDLANPVKASCGLCNGTASSTPSGGNGGYQFSWSALAQTSASISSLCLGTYTVTVTDDKSCTATGAVTVGSVANIIVNAVPTSPLCPGSCNGKVTTSPSGGTPPYQFLWSNSGTGQNISNQCTGNFTVTVTDAAGCSSTSTAAIVNPPAIIPNLNPTNISCSGACDGSVYAAPTGGTGAYTYSWSNAATGATISALCPNTYILTITDMNGCTQDSSVTLTQPAPLADNPTITDATCKFNDGVISVSPTGGSGPYTYSWSNGGTGATINSLAIGSYVLTLSSGPTCQSVFIYNISDLGAPALMKTRTDDICYGQCNGMATVTASGNAPFTFDWSTGSTSGTISSLCVGVYSLSVTDGLGCITVDTVGITQPLQISPNAIVTNVSCGGAGNGMISLVPSGGTSPYTYSWSVSGGPTGSSVSNLAPGPYSFTITDANGCDTMNTITITQPSSLSILNIVGVNVKCFGQCTGAAFVNVTGGTPTYTYAWSDATTGSLNANLCPETYTVSVTDMNGCFTSSTVTITQPASALSALIGETDALCNAQSNGSVYVTPGGGTMPYSYSWNPTAATSSTVSGVAAGIYSVTVSDANACTVNSSATVGQPGAISFTVSSSNTSCNGSGDGSVNVTASGGSGSFSYVWSIAATGSTISGLSAGSYSVTATDANGCTGSTVVAITQPGAVLPNVIATNPSCLSANSGSVVSTPSGGNGNYTYLWNTAQTGSSLSNLSAGIYSVVITDIKGCTGDTSVTLTPPVPVDTMNTLLVEPSCGVSNGSISVSASGGNGAYLYSWSPTGSTAATITALSAGNYSLTISDTQGCTGTFVIPLNNIGGPTGETEVTTNILCYGSCTGTAAVNPIGGTPPYTYSWSNTNDVDSTQANMCAGNYTLKVTDHLGCIRNSPVVITQPLPFVFIPTVTNASCSGICDGSATLTASGGNGPYSFVWSNAATGATQNNLCPLTYTVTLTDASSCIATTTVTVGALAVLVAQVTQTNPLCNGTCSGRAALSTTGGTGPYAYTWSNGVVIDSAQDLCANTYTVSISDSKSCNITQTVLITQPAPISVSPVITMATCGVCNGQISVQVNGGTVPYNYSWSNAATGQTISGLCAALYNLDVSDSSHCKASFLLPLSNAGGPASSGITTTNVTCPDQCNGTASLAPSGGTAPYTYNWQPSGQNSISVSGLCAGLSFVEIADSNGCILTDSVFIGGPTPILITAVSTAPSTCLNNDGSAYLTVSGGSSPYTFLWSNAATAATQSNLAAGMYGVSVTDASGCLATTVVSVNSINGPFVSITDSSVSCFGRCDGKAFASATGGNGVPYTFLWSNSPASVVDSALGLCATGYFVQVTDGAGCVTVSSVSINQPAAFGLSISHATTEKCLDTCNGSITAFPEGGVLPYTFAWSNFLGKGVTAGPLCKGVYALTVTDANGCTVTQMDSVRSPLPLTTLNTLVNASCNNTKDGSVIVVTSGGSPGYNYHWSNGTSGSTDSNLGAGSYTVTITDANGCPRLDSATVAATTTVIAKAGSDTTICQGIAYTLSGANSISGLSYQWLQLPSFTLVGSTVTTTVQPAPGLTDYILVAMNGTCADSDTVALTVNPFPLVNAGNPQSIFTFQSVVIGGDPTSTAPGATYLWTPIESLSSNDSAMANPTATPLATTIYKVIVRDAEGCTASDSVLITVVPEVNITSGFTPNGDGKNDTWIIDDIQKFPNCLVEVYNRWGELLFSSRGYPTPWDGKFNGQELPVGTYYYAVTLNDPRFPKPFTGPLTIVR